MAYYLLISFIIFCVVDYKYIYMYLDKKIIFSSSGSKLKQEILGKESLIKDYKILLEYPIYLISLILVVIALFFLNYSISINIFNTSPLEISLFTKSIDIRDVMSSIWDKFQILYYFAYAMFLIIIVFKNSRRIINVILLVKKKMLGYEEIVLEEDKNKFILAADENSECVEMEEDELYKNVLITGSIGSGKTSGAISRICYHLIKSGKGGLILDAKGNFVDIVSNMCQRCGRYKDIRVISKKSDTYFNIMNESTSNSELATNIKQVLVLLSPKNNTDEYWLDKVENLLMNLFILMQYKDNKRDILELHRLVTDNNYLRTYIVKVKEKIKEDLPTDKTAFELTNAITFLDNEYKNMDSRVSSIIKSEITRFTIPLITDYEIYNQFCINSNKRKEINFKDPNSITILSINMGENKSLSKIISILLKLEFQKQILSNISNPIPMFFICDEYQEFVNIEDSYFLSLSREAKCISVISTQSYSSLKNTLKDSSATNVIIQNLVNKIWFRNDDLYTISEIIKQLGKTNVLKENKSISETGQESRKFILREGFKNKKSSISKTLNYVYTKENEFDENFFTRELKTFEALTFLSTNEGKIELKKAIFERWNFNE